MGKGSIPRRAAKRDANEDDIVDALKRANASVEKLSGKGVPDLLVGYRRQTFLLEVKAPKTGKLTGDQVTWHLWWCGAPVHVVLTQEDALVAIGALDRDAH